MQPPIELNIGDVIKFRCYGKVVKGTITDFAPSLFDGPALICVKVKRERERERDHNQSGKHNP